MAASIEVIVLGSGAAFPSSRARLVRQPAGYAIRIAGRVILFDFGFGNLRQLCRAGLDPAQITDVFASHRHPDHVGDLAALLFLFKYDVKPCRGRVRLWGPRGFSAFVRRLQRAHHPWCQARGYTLSVGDLRSGQTVSLDGGSVEGFSVPHPTPSLAYRFLYKGKSVVYSGDTSFCSGLADFAAQADLFLLECASTQAQAFEGHLTPKVALATLEASGCRRGLLTHLSDQTARQLKTLSRGTRFSLAHDLQRLRL